MADRFRKQRKQHSRDKRKVERQFHSHRKGALLKGNPRAAPITGTSAPNEGT